MLFLATAYTFAQAQQLEVKQLAKKVWVHTSYNMYGGTTVPSNGLLVSTSDGVVLIDMAWGDEQTEQLLTWVKENLKQPVKICIVTHAHHDRMSSIPVLHKHNVTVYSSAKTARLAAAQELSSPDTTLALNQEISVGEQKLVVFYPRAGHTADNVVVYLPQQKVLFGGCLVKDAKAINLGNTADADLSNWPNAIQQVQQKFPKAKRVVPGHGQWSDQIALTHTLHLLQQHAKK
ncbi:subclass B1 metallo-beta-lactamase [Pontibacter toksunensis]|uniref:beta-lactamase n=2 Tax=Pontibacter toksunensis TaxID=1332631 RepID=A0ABW6BRB8_9BACT